jgi:hypothetical protein
VDTVSSFLGCKVAGAWNRPLNSNLCRG